MVEQDAATQQRSRLSFAAILCLYAKKDIIISQFAYRWWGYRSRENGKETILVNKETTTRGFERWGKP